MSHYTMPNKYGKCTRDFGAFLFLLVSTFLYFGGVFNKTIILLALVGYINNSRHLARKYARIFVRGHYLFRKANSFPRAKLEENCELRGTDNVQGQISELITHPLIFEWFYWLLYVTWCKSPDSDHAITPARVDICPPIVSVEEKQSAQEF